MGLMKLYIPSRFCQVLNLLIREFLLYRAAISFPATADADADLACFKFALNMRHENPYL
jgi:hypothetical protein